MLFKAVLFDMDGLLLDSERQYLEAFLRSCKFFGLRNMEHVFYDCIGLRLDDRTKVLEKAFFDMGNIVLKDMALMSKNLQPKFCKKAQSKTVGLLASKPVAIN